MILKTKVLVLSTLLAAAALAGCADQGEEAVGDDEDNDAMNDTGNMTGDGGMGVGAGHMPNDDKDDMTPDDDKDASW